jgi:hypothetical protein
MTAAWLHAQAQQVVQDLDLKGLLVGYLSSRIAASQFMLLVILQVMALCLSLLLLTCQWCCSVLCCLPAASKVMAQWGECLRPHVSQD